MSRAQVQTDAEMVVMIIWADILHILGVLSKYEGIYT